MKMEIVFDLQKALAGASVVTKDGRKVRELKLFDTVQDFPLVGILYGGELQRWNKFGIAREAHHDESNLTMVPVKKEGWVNLYRNQVKRPGGGFSESVYVGHGEVFPNPQYAEAGLLTPWGDPGGLNKSLLIASSVRIEWEE